MCRQNFDEHSVHRFSKAAVVPPPAECLYSSYLLCAAGGVHLLSMIDGSCSFGQYIRNTRMNFAVDRAHKVPSEYDLEVFLERGLGITFALPI
jgi:hypothetical protein